MVRATTTTTTTKKKVGEFLKKMSSKVRPATAPVGRARAAGAAKRVRARDGFRSDERGVREESHLGRRRAWLTMCDAPERLVEERDAGNNFMVVKNALSRCGGKNNNTITEETVPKEEKKRGEMVCEHLRVLNANVEVTFWDEDPRQIVERCFHAAATAAATKDKDDQREANEENGGDYYHRLQEFDIVIASQLDEATTIKLDDIAKRSKKSC